MTTERGEPLRRARRLEGEHKSALVVAALDAAVARGRRPTISGIAREAGVGRKFIYDHPELRAQVELRAAQVADHQANDLRASARVTGASLRADLENARAQNRRLQDRLRAAEGRLSELQGACILSDDSFPEAMLTELADQALAKRNAELERIVFEAKEELRRTTEEFDAARTINRELMQGGNRSDPAGSEGALA